ncbi:SGNH/GDSL hydrolase family protein [Flavihumibacter petaseus]|uniref:SGNH hydrolase-type esterase domain-containing protein n=1 Tax=Flavihumibacter petaseus NBRC 106054 TaxID=1220578 RepID=A0A0E9N5T5_9BACT|nr:SGNH/GDSL hydrolase family protein [Flavihumibacter petaseus]GAO45322.1 hypothetical protein FPE01S_05_00190 [Flavihumibacter petaseus NBRC 106054]
MSLLTYLALGDSYTIGEQVSLEETYAYQLVQLLRKKGVSMAAPEIIARTGWTTGELKTAMDGYTLLPRYDRVSLLIGVNNQYRGYPVDLYAEGFEELLTRAIVLAGENAAAVMVLSVPDWGVTPFAEGRDRRKIAAEIDTFNAINRGITETMGCGYTDITPLTREAARDASLLAGDGLHPSAKDYRRWSGLLAATEWVSSICDRN